MSSLGDVSRARKTDRLRRTHPARMFAHVGVVVLFSIFLNVTAITKSFGDLPEALIKMVEELGVQLPKLNDADKKALRADAKFTKLVTATDAMRDETDALSVARLADALTTKLKGGKFTAGEAAAIPKALEPLVAQITARIDTSKLKVHIVSATYGDHRTFSRRTCDAVAYFRSKCEGTPRCPLDADKDKEMVLNGANLCGYEPAPQAAPGVNSAVVKYRCVNFELRPWKDVAADDSGIPMEFRGKGQIICQQP